MADETLYRAVLPDGTRLAPSLGTTPDAFRGAVLDNLTNQLRGQAEFVEVVPDALRSKSSNLTYVFALSTAVLAGTIAYQNRSKIKRLWHRAVAKMPLRRTAIRAEQAELVQSVDSSAFATEVDVILDEDASEMTIDEAARRLIEIVLASATIVENWEQLRSAVIVDQDRTHELHASIAKLTSGDVFDRVVFALENESLDDALRQEFLDRFGGEADDTSSTLCHERLRSALRSPDGSE